MVNQALFNECVDIIGSNNLNAAINLYLVITGGRKGARLELSETEATAAFNTLWKKDWKRMMRSNKPLTDADRRIIGLRDLNNRDDHRFVNLVAFCEKHSVWAVRNHITEVCIQKKDRSPSSLKRHLLASYDEADYQSFCAFSAFLEYPKLTEAEFNDYNQGRRDDLTRREVSIVLSNNNAHQLVTYMYTKQKTLKSCITASRVNDYLAGLVLPNGQKIIRCEDSDTHGESF